MMEDIPEEITSLEQHDEGVIFQEQQSVEMPAATAATTVVDPRNYLLIRDQDHFQEAADDASSELDVPPAPQDEEREPSDDRGSCCQDSSEESCGPLDQVETQRLFAAILEHSSRPSWLPHYRSGSPSSGRLFSSALSNGNTAGAIRAERTIQQQQQQQPSSASATTSANPNRTTIPQVRPLQDAAQRAHATRRRVLIRALGGVKGLQQVMSLVQDLRWVRHQLILLTSHKVAMSRRVVSRAALGELPLAGRQIFLESSLVHALEKTPLHELHRIDWNELMEQSQGSLRACQEWLALKEVRE